VVGVASDVLSRRVLWRWEGEKDQLDDDEIGIKGVGMDVR